MLTYALMGLPFIGFVLLLDMVILRTWVVRLRRTWIVMAVLLVLTAIFDQLLVIHIVNYNEAHLLGLRLWRAPIEDFSYTIAAVIGLSSILQHISNTEKD